MSLQINGVTPKTIKVEKNGTVTEIKTIKININGEEKSIWTKS